MHRAMLRSVLRTAPTVSRASLLSRTLAKRNFHVHPIVLGRAEAVLQENLEDIKIEPIARPNEPTEKKRSRLLWQSRKRGILETCVILGKFAKEHLPTMTREELDEYDLFMNENDWDIYYWVTDTPDAPLPCPERWEKSIIMPKLRQVGKNENRELMHQPNLY